MELTRLWRWERFEPDLGNNRYLEPAGRFFLEIAVGLTKEQLQALREQVTAAMTSDADWGAALATALEPWARLGTEPLILDRKPITSLAEYFIVCAGVANASNMLELPRALFEANRPGGCREAFFERLHEGFEGFSDGRKPSRG